MKLAWVGIFGLLGVYLRFGVSLWWAKLGVFTFPYATFFINILGSFLIGIVYVLGVEKTGLPLSLTTGIIVGFLGGFTTFSSYCLETVRLIEQRLFLPALGYFVLSPAVGFFAVWGGIWLARIAATQTALR